jgi:peroxiredoxin
MTKLKVGQKAPNVQLQTLAGESVMLDSFWGNGRFALLIFLRHLA